jgi:hypothetical protein
MTRFPPAPRLWRTGTRQTERLGRFHNKAFSLLRGKQKARIFVYPVGIGKRSFSFGARPRLPRSEREASYYWGFPPPPNFVPTSLARASKTFLSYQKYNILTTNSNGYIFNIDSKQRSRLSLKIKKGGKKYAKI